MIIFLLYHCSTYSVSGKLAKKRDKKGHSDDESTYSKSKRKKTEIFDKQFIEKLRGESKKAKGPRLSRDELYKKMKKLLRSVINEQSSSRDEYDEMA